MKALQLTAIGLAIGSLVGLMTVFAVPSRFEIVVWLLLIANLGFLGSRLFPDAPFRRTFAFSLLVGITITSTHLVFVDAYLQGHPEEVETLEAVRILDSTRWTLLLIAPAYWAVLGSLSGACAHGLSARRTPRTG